MCKTINFQRHQRNKIYTDHENPLSLYFRLLVLLPTCNPIRFTETSELHCDSWSYRWRTYGKSVWHDVDKPSQKYSQLTSTKSIKFSQELQSITVYGFAEQSKNVCIFYHSSKVVLQARSEIRVVVSKDGDIGVAEQPANWPGNFPGGGFFPPNFSPPTARPRPPKVPTTAFTFGTSQEPASSIATASDEPSSTIFTTEHPGRPETVAPPSVSKSYLAFLAIPAALLLLVPLAVCYCRRRNYQRALRQEKIRIEKSPSADTTKSMCKVQKHSCQESRLLRNTMVEHYF